MIIDIDEQIRFRVSFDPADRETGFDDDIRFAILERGPAEFRLFGGMRPASC